MRRLAVIGCLGFVASIASAPSIGAAPEASLAVQVNDAIDRGTRFLRTCQKADGSYRGAHAQYFSLGLTGLVVHALVKSGVSPTEPELQRAVDFLTRRRAKTVYDAAFVILGLDAAKDVSRYPFLQETARWLCEGERKGEGLWGYPQPPADLSNTQVALLALAAAARRGVETPKAVFKAAIRSLPAFRQRGGGYAYRAPPAAGLPTGSMTTAALTILHLVERGLEEQGGSRVLQKRAGKLADEAWAWMDRRFSAEANPIGGHFFTGKSTFYYLYGVERAAALANRSRIGGRDWYREGARFLVEAQGEDGSWGSTSDTCFALLFLRRATFTGLGRTVESLDGVDDEAPGLRPAGLPEPGRGVVPITSWLSLGPFPSPPDRDAPAVPADESTLRPRETHRVHRMIWTRIEAGQDGIKLPLAGTNPAHQLGYLGTWLHASVDIDVVLWIEQQGGVSVRLGGQPIYERRIDVDLGRATPIPLHLKKGVTPLVLRWESWVEAARLVATLSTPGGLDAHAVRWSVSSEGPDTQADLASRPAVVGWPELFGALVVDDDGPLLAFGEPGDLDRVVLLAEHAVSRTLTKTRPRFGLARPDLSASGLLEARLGPGTTLTLLRKVRAPAAGAKIVARLALIGPNGRDPKRRIEAHIGVYDKEATILAEKPVKNAAAEARDPWATLEAPLPSAKGETVLLFLVVKAEPGAFTGADRLYVDEFSLR